MPATKQVTREAQRRRVDPELGSDLWAVDDWLRALMPDADIFSLQRWMAQHRGKYVNDPYFYRRGQPAGVTLLYTVLKYIYGDRRA